MSCNYSRMKVLKNNKQWFNIRNFTLDSAGPTSTRGWWSRLRGTSRSSRGPVPRRANDLEDNRHAMITSIFVLHSREYLSWHSHGDPKQIKLASHPFVCEDCRCTNFLFATNVGLANGRPKQVSVLLNPVCSTLMSSYWIQYQCKMSKL